MSDLEYLTTGMFTVFFPNTQAGETAWKAIAKETNGTGKILTTQLTSALTQLRNAGYSVKKLKKPTNTIDKIYHELDQLIA